MGVVIFVDNRERALIEFREQLYHTKGADYEMAHGSAIEWRVGKLDLGDIQIYDSKSKTHMVFERKTFQDISSSIKDGRYREQKARLLAHFRPAQIMYILEDFNTQLFFTIRSSRQSFFGLSKSTYEGFFLNTMYRDKIHIHRSSGIEETFCFVLEIAKRIHADATVFPKAVLIGGGTTAATESGESTQKPAEPSTERSTETETETDNTEPFKDYIDLCKIKEKKIKNITPLVCFQMQLGQIPYISSSISKNITKTYTSMKAMMADLNQCATQAERLTRLSKIPLVGKKKAISILEFLGFSEGEAKAKGETDAKAKGEEATVDVKNEINESPMEESSMPAS
jgi:ERCC4-type nuclease